MASKRPARISALHNWFSNAETQLGLRDTVQLNSTPSALVGLLLTWTRDGRITPARTGRHPHQSLPTALGQHPVYLANHGPGSSGWMATPPSAALGLSFDSPTYRVLLKWHLGIPLVPAAFEGCHESLNMRLPCGYLREPHGTLRGADIFIPSWDIEQGLVIDVGVVHPYPGPITALHLPLPPSSAMSAFGRN
jgi:hypothetical protein